MTLTNVDPDGNKPTDIVKTVTYEYIAGKLLKKVIYKVAKKAISVTRQTVDDLIKKATPGRSTKGRTSQHNLSGGYTKAIKDFKSLNPKITKDTPGLKIGKLKDGRTVIVRSKSSDGRPTIEIQNGKKKTKFRY